MLQESCLHFERFITMLAVECPLVTVNPEMSRDVRDKAAGLEADGALVDLPLSLVLLSS